MDCNFTLCKRYLNGNCIKQVGEKCQLEVAKKIINAFLDFESACMENGIKIADNIREQAEQFIGEEK